MGTFLASRKVCGRLEPSKSSPTRPIPASICLLMSALECSQAILCVIQSPPTARPLAPRSGPSAERIGGPRRCVSRRRGGLERVFLARSARPGPRLWKVGAECTGRLRVHSQWVGSGRMVVQGSRATDWAACCAC